MLHEFWSKITKAEMKQAWQWLLYLDFILPLLLFALAWLIPGRLPAVWHAYNLYVINPLPNLQTMTGIIGFAYHLAALGYAVKKRNRKDFLLSLLITVLVAVFFFLEINYRLVSLLQFS